MVDYGRAIKRPFTDAKKLFIGIILSLPVPILKILSNPIASGYAYECGKASFKNKYGMPKWKNYFRLWINAFIAGVIALIYFIPVILVLFKIVKNLKNGGIDIEKSMTSLFLNPSLRSEYALGVFSIIALSIILGYFVPIAILNWIITGKFSSAFDFEDIFKKTLNKKYLKVWTVLSLIWVAVSYINLILVLNFLQKGRLLEPPALNNSLSFFKFAVLILFSSSIEFITKVFTYTAYGEFLREIKKKR